MFDNDPPRPKKLRRRIAVRAAILYFLVAAVWIVFSDALAELLFRDQFQHALVQTGKGLFFVAIMALLVYIVLRRSQEQQRTLEGRLRDALEATRDGVWFWDIKADHMEVTSGGDADVGWHATESVRNIASWRAIVHPDDWACAERRMAQLFEKGSGEWLIDQRIQAWDGNWIWYRMKGNVTSRDDDRQPLTLEGTYTNIDQLKRTQLRLEHANRALQVLVTGNKAIEAGREPRILFPELVSRLAEFSDFPLVSIGVVQDDGQIVTLCQAGPLAPALKRTAACCDDQDQGDGPSARAVQTGQPEICEDARTDPTMTAWRDRMAACGILSTIAVPILDEDRVRYVLRIDSTEVAAFDERDVETYRTLSEDLSLALHTRAVERNYVEAEQNRTLLAERLEKALRASISALAAAVEKRDPYTAGHQMRVADIAVDIARHLGLDDVRIEGIRLGATMHDIGKIAIPTEILTKPGRLDASEYALIQRHAELGYDIVKGIDFTWPVADVVHQHHERWDGSGYPQGLSGEAIILEARIVAVADVIESMATHRPYRKQIPFSDVVAEIENGAGTKYDPRVARAALAVMDENAVSLGLNAA